MDLIDRQDAIGKIQTWLKHSGYSEGERNVMGCTIQMLESLPSAQKNDEIDPNDDLIKRQDAIEAVTKYCTKYDLRELLADIEVLPTARKTGKWIACDSSEHWKCSECGCRASYWFNEENSSSYELDMSEWLSDYCPNCGARMEEE